jgi:indolepyruvate ferredoxin oxidoreductase alpha subunit
MRFCAGKRAVLMVEEGQPEFIEQDARHASCARPICRRRVHGKDLLPMAGEYTGAVVLNGHRRLHAASFAGLSARRCRSPRAATAPKPRVRSAGTVRQALGTQRAAASAGLLHRLPGAARSFTAMKLRRARDRTSITSAADIGCHLFSILPPFNIGNTTHGLRPGPGRARRRCTTESTSGADRDDGRRRLLAQRAHQRRRQRGVQPGTTTCCVIVDNGYTSATGGQDILSSEPPAAPIRATKPCRSRARCAAWASSGCRTMHRTYERGARCATAA